MKRISVTRASSGRSGRRRGSQNPGMATEAADWDIPGEGGTWADAGPTLSPIPSTAHVVMTVRNGLFARNFIFMIGARQG